MQLKARKSRTQRDNGIGPRVIGGRYLSGYWQEAYTVVAISNPTGSWSLTSKWERDGHTTTHFTPWDSKRDRVLEAR